MRSRCPSAELDVGESLIQESSLRGLVNAVAANYLVGGTNKGAHLLILSIFVREFGFDLLLGVVVVKVFTCDG